MSITINVTPTTGGSFSAEAVTSDNLSVSVGSNLADNVTLSVGGGIGPPGAGNVALAAGDGITISSTSNVATISSTVQGVPQSVLENLSNVLSSSATTGDVLAWDGTSWAANANYATLSYVDSAVSNLVDAAPGALDTLNELAAAIGDDANFSTTITTSLAGKAAANHTHTFQEITSGTATVTGSLTLNASTGGVVVNGGASPGSLTLNCEQNTHGVTIASPAHSVGATYTLTLPATAGSANQVLTTDGSGSLSWSNGTSGGSGGGITWTTPAPASSADSGNAGDVAYSGRYFFLHNGTQWNRVELSAFSAPITYRLLTEAADTILAESGDYLAHDGVPVSVGPLYSWGENTDGTLGDGTTSNSSAPLQIGTADWQSISSSEFNAVAIKSDGTLWAWGLNADGQIGDGTAVAKTAPVQIGSSAWAAASSGWLFSTGIKSDGTLWAWGRGTSGQLGDGTATGSTTPVQVGTATYDAVASGRLHSMAIKSDGTLWGWGYNSSGEIGDGTNTQRNSPVQIGTATWNAVSCGDGYSVAIKSDGTLWATGDNTYGKLGDGSTTNRNTFSQIGTATWLAVGCHKSWSLAVKSDGTLWAWGRNDYGQLGDGTTTTRLSPVQIGTATWDAIGSGHSESHSVAIKSDGTLWAWGRNNFGQLGDGSTTDSTSPIQIGTATWRSVAVGGSHSHAIGS